MAKSDDILSLRTICNDFVSLDKQSYFRANLGDTFNFAEINEDLDGIIFFYSRLREIRLDLLPQSVITELMNTTQSLIANLKRVVEFKIDNNNPFDVRKNLIKSIRNDFVHLVKNHTHLIGGFHDPTDKIEREKEFQLSKSQSIMKLNKDQAEAEKIKRELDSILKAAKETAPKIGAAAHSAHFAGQANEHREKANNWFGSIVTVVVLIVAWAIAWFRISPPDKGDTYQIIQYTVSKLVVLSALYFILSHAVKNYKAHRHNFIVNQHKANCLNTFETFVKGAGEDQQTKNAILISATQSIFSQQPSGYSSIEPDTDTNKIIEIINTKGTQQ